MPTYEFRCPNGHTFEQFHKISDAPSTATCPTCGAAAERAISGGAGLVFKGSGFYLTDYGKNAHRTSGPAPKGGESGGESSGGTKSSEGSASGGGSSSSPAPTSSPTSESKSSTPKGDGGAKGAA